MSEPRSEHDPTPMVVCFATVKGAQPCRRRNAETGDICQCVEGHNGPHAAWASPDLPPYRTWPQAAQSGRNTDDLGLTGEVDWENYVDETGYA